jgi:hypothetical protein
VRAAAEKNHIALETKAGGERPHFGKQGSVSCDEKPRMRNVRADALRRAQEGAVILHR